MIATHAKPVFFIERYWCICSSSVIFSYRTDANVNKKEGALVLFEKDREGSGGNKTSEKGRSGPPYVHPKYNDWSAFTSPAGSR
jgi:hypothetical protein